MDSDSVFLAFGVPISTGVVRSAVQAGVGRVSVEWNVLNYPRNFSQVYLPRYFLLLLTCEVLSGVRCVSFGFSNSPP